MVMPKYYRFVGACSFVDLGRLVSEFASNAHILTSIDFNYKEIQQIENDNLFKLKKKNQLK